MKIYENLSRVYTLDVDIIIYLANLYPSKLSIPLHIGVFPVHVDIEFGLHLRIAREPFNNSSFLSMNANPLLQEYSALNSFGVFFTLTLPFKGAARSSHCPEII